MKEIKIIAVKIGWIITLMIIAVGLTVWVTIANNKEEQRIHATEFESYGIVESIRTVYTEGGGFLSLSSGKQVYIHIGGKDYEISSKMASYIIKGDEVKVSGELGQIKSIEKVE